MNTVASPLRYPGSKIRLVKYLGKILEFNSIEPDVFVEPFVGGGSVFMNFVAANLTKKAIIGDLDPLISSFWKVLFEDPGHLIEFVKKVKINRRQFAYYKEIAANSSELDTRKLAETCLFLNRTSFSGLLTQVAGPIGGKNQNSPYSIDCRFNRTVLAQRIKQISLLSSRVTVLAADWNQTIDFAIKKCPTEKLLFYFDPPFFRKAERLYRHYFTDVESHLALQERLIKLGHHWFLSYDRAKEIREMYRPLIHGSFAFPYSINSPARRIEKEYFITSKGIKRPTRKFLQE